jgi:hypothetical protein
MNFFKLKLSFSTKNQLFWSYLSFLGPNEVSWFTMVFQSETLVLFVKHYKNLRHLLHQVQNCSIISKLLQNIFKRLKLNQKSQFWSQKSLNNGPIIGSIEPQVEHSAKSRQNEPFWKCWAVVTGTQKKPKLSSKNFSNLAFQGSLLIHICS